MSESTTLISHVKVFQFVSPYFISIPIVIPMSKVGSNQVYRAVAIGSLHHQKCKYINMIYIMNAYGIDTLKDKPTMHDCLSVNKHR